MINNEGFNVSRYKSLLASGIAGLLFSFGQPSDLAAESGQPAPATGADRERDSLKEKDLVVYSKYVSSVLNTLSLYIQSEDQIRDSLQRVGIDGLIQEDVESIITALESDRDFIVNNDEYLESGSYDNMEERDMVRFIIAMLRTKILFDSHRYQDNSFSLSDVFEDAAFDRRIRESGLQLVSEPEFWTGLLTTLDIFMHEARKNETKDEGKKPNISDILFADSETVNEVIGIYISNLSG